MQQYRKQSKNKKHYAQIYLFFLQMVNILNFLYSFSSTFGQPNLLIVPSSLSHNYLGLLCSTYVTRGTFSGFFIEGGLGNQTLSPQKTIVNGSVLYTLNFAKRVKSLNDLYNHDGVVTHTEPDILECEVKWVLGNSAVYKASGCNRILVELLRTLRDDAIKVLYSLCQQIWKTQQWS